MSQPIRNPWSYESDWLVSLMMLGRKYDDDDRMRVGEEIGYLLGFAEHTNTRIMAEVSDDGDDFTLFSILFSFHSQAGKKRFLELVRENGPTDHEQGDLEQFAVPTRDEIEDAEPLIRILPRDIGERAAARSKIVARSLRKIESEHGIAS